MAILRSFIFMPKSNLQRPDSLPVVRHPDDVFLRDDVILKNVSQPTIWGGIFAIAASLIPNNAVWKPVIRLAKGHDLGPPVWRSPEFQRKPMTPVQRRLASPEFMEMIDRPRPVAGAEFIGGG
jgi:hypothetical protein